MNLIFKNIFCLLFFFFQTNNLAMHAIHISYGEVTVKGNEFYGKLTFYYDDFMLALKNFDGGNIQNFTAEQYTSLKYSYLKNHLIVKVNSDKKLNLIITGNSGNDKSIWFIFKFDSDVEIRSISLKYDVLMNEYGDQLNLLNIRTSSGDKSLIFSESKNELKIID